MFMKGKTFRKARFEDESGKRHEKVNKWYMMIVEKSWLIMTMTEVSAFFTIMIFNDHFRLGCYRYYYYNTSNNKKKYIRHSNFAPPYNERHYEF